MNSFKDLEKALDFDINSILDRVMDKPEIRKEIIELNQTEQLSEGIDAKGQRIVTISATEQGLGNVYSAYTIQERKSSGLQTNNVDLRDSGNFWETFEVSQTQKGWEVLADYDIHEPHGNIKDNFDARYDFTGLTNDNTDYFARNILLPDLQQEMRIEKNI